MTPEQIATLEQEKERLVAFENNDYSFIDLFNTEGEYDIEKSFYHLTDFYDFIQEKEKEKKTRKKCYYQEILLILAFFILIIQYKFSHLDLKV